MDTNAPLFISVPWMEKGLKTKSLAEYVDIYNGENELKEGIHEGSSAESTRGPLEIAVPPALFKRQGACHLKGAPNSQPAFGHPSQGILVS